jgi:hypothetical protein
MRSLVEYHPFAKEIASAISPGIGLGFLLLGAVTLFISAIMREKPYPDISGLQSTPTGDALWFDKLARLGEGAKDLNSSAAAALNTAPPTSKISAEVALLRHVVRSLG